MGSKPTPRARHRPRHTAGKTPGRRRRGQAAVPVVQPLSWRSKAELLAQLASWGLRWLRRDTRYPSPVPDNPKFMSPHDAVALIRDGVTFNGARALAAGKRIFHATHVGLFQRILTDEVSNSRA
jgi:hypothetical protein